MLRTFQLKSISQCICLRALTVFLLCAAGAQACVAQTPPPVVRSAGYHADEAMLASYDGQYRYLDEPSPVFVTFYLGEPETLFSLSHQDGDVYIEGPRTPRTRLRQNGPYDLGSPGSRLHYLMQHDSSGHVTGWTRVIGPAKKEAASKEAVSGGENDATARHAIKIADMPLTYTFPEYSRSEAMIPMRDGVKLHVVILRPAKMGTDAASELPILMLRTPYGVDGWTSNSLNSGHPELARSGYIFVFQDIRGRYESEGQFVMNRPIVHTLGNRTDPLHIDESSDTYDTVEWLIHNVPGNNGRVGVMGISYDGYTAMMAGIDPHSAVKAISPQAPMTNIWMGDDFFHNGAFRQAYGFDYVGSMETPNGNFAKLNEDAYDYFLREGNFATAAKAAGIEDLPTAKVFIAHPEYAQFWRDMAVEPHLTAAAMPTPIPTLEVGGWWDQEDMWGPQTEYAALKPHDTKHDVFLVLGPWRHGGWSESTEHLGQVDFGQFTTDEFRVRFEAPFFAYYLKGEPGFDLKDTATFQTGTDRWMRYGAWPPVKHIDEKNLFLQADGSLNFHSPSKSSNAYREYVSDPADPVPYRHRPIQTTYSSGSQWYTWLVEDQRFVTSRPDVATWTTAPLDHDVTVTGDVTADIFAATSGSDADWVVKLIDVYPQDTGRMAGFELMINAEIFRGRYLKSFEQPEPLVPNVVNQFKWSLHGTDHVFLKGHRIMVEVQSSWFPLYDRNPQTFVQNIMTAKPDTYQKETERIYCSPRYPSSILLPVATQAVSMSASR